MAATEDSAGWTSPLLKMLVACESRCNSPPNTRCRSGGDCAKRFLARRGPDNRRVQQVIVFPLTVKFGEIWSEPVVLRKLLRHSLKSGSVWRETSGGTLFGLCAGTAVEMVIMTDI